VAKKTLEKSRVSRASSQQVPGNLGIRTEMKVRVAGAEAADLQTPIPEAGRPPGPGSIRGSSVPQK